MPRYQKPTKKTSKNCTTGAIDKNLKQKLTDLIGLRNIIVHMYADIKAEIVYENLDDTITTLKHSTKRLLEFCKEKGNRPIRRT